jgi:protein-tyrosine phosphatase
MENINTIITDGTNQEKKNNISKIDFHTHILPGIDDGSSSVEESLEMLSLLEKSGVDTVICTPHFYPDSTMLDSFLKKREAAFESLKPHLEKFRMDIRLGAEIYFFNGISKSQSIEALKIEKTDYLLVEMPFCTWHTQTINEILELNSRYDIKVVIAHIDRYMDWYSDMETESLLSFEDAVFQVNNNAFFKKNVRKKVCDIIKDGYRVVLGSDTHDLANRRPNFDLIEKELSKFKHRRMSKLLENSLSTVVI